MDRVSLYCSLVRSLDIEQIIASIIFNEYLIESVHSY
jgi:hypothetical protein